MRGSIIPHGNDRHSHSGRSRATALQHRTESGSPSGKLGRSLSGQQAFVVGAQHAGVFRVQDGRVLSVSTPLC